MKTQAEIDKARREMAEKVVADRNLTMLEEAKAFATEWIILAAQHLTNEEFYRDRMLYARPLRCDRCTSLATCFGADYSRCPDHCGNPGCK